MGKGYRRKPQKKVKYTDDFVARVLYSWEKRAETLRGLGYTVFREEGIYFYGRMGDIKSVTFLEPPPEDWLLVDDPGTMAARKAILTQMGFEFAVTDDAIYYKKAGQKSYRRFETNDDWVERITPTLPDAVPAVYVSAPAVPAVHEETEKNENE